jgi:hypothetical protein
MFYASAKSGTFYIAKRGTSHIAATKLDFCLTPILRKVTLPTLEFRAPECTRRYDDCGPVAA